MDIAGQSVPLPLTNGAGLAVVPPDKQPFAFPTYPNDTKHRNTPRRPSALQVSVTANSMDELPRDSTKSPTSPTTTRSYNDSPDFFPQSPNSRTTPSLESPKSPRERLEAFLRLEDPQPNGEVRNKAPAPLGPLPSIPSKAQSYSQLRNASSPLPESAPLGNSSPPSPRSMASPPPTGSPLRPGQGPRTSSIDSAISSMSLITTHSPKGSLDSSSTSSSDVSGLIKTAGSAENLINHLLREKKHLEGRTDQLWNLVDKQRKLLLGLNEDLLKAIRDKERYRKDLEELQSTTASMSNATPVPPKAPLPARDRSPAPSDSSADLPIQRQSQTEVDLEPSRDDIVTPRPAAAMPGQQRADFDQPASSSSATEEVAPAQLGDSRISSQHAHKHTSSSDLGVFNISKASKDIAPLQTHTLTREAAASPPLSASSNPTISPTSSFSAKRAQTSSSKPFPGPALTLTESTPTDNDSERMTPPRKPPPAPLDLDRPKKAAMRSPANREEDISGSEYEDEPESGVIPAFERGRKKTREEDDQEREVLQYRQEEERSKSKKKKSSKSRSESQKSKSQTQSPLEKGQPLPLASGIRALAPEPTPALASSFLSQPASLASILDPATNQKGKEVGAQSKPMKAPLSPGLPLSPRPGDRPVNAPTPRMPRDTNNAAASPPLSPNSGFVGLPVSPRAPKQWAPLLPHTPVSITSPTPPPAASDSRSESSEIIQSSSHPAKRKPSSEKVSMDSESSQTTGPPTAVPPIHGIYRGLVSEAYPGLLLPPNALPSIKITVVSSRLKPSRQSLVFKGDDEPVFTLGVSARFDEQGLWKIEKPILSLQHLDHQMRQTNKLDVKLPDRSLFSGHAPAKIDARRIALERYFDILLDTQLDEKAAVCLCQYLSTNASEPITGPDSNVVTARPSPAVPSGHERTTKEGYLTKRGKNFGGWKARYFVLDEPILRYFETPNGNLLGTIKLHRAKIGKQSPPKNTGSGDESDGQYRHAFLIREPKKKDSSSFIDHVLCAENDEERDSWVLALMGYVSGPEAASGSRAQIERHDDLSAKTKPPPLKQSTKQNVLLKDSPTSEDFESLQSVPYEKTQAAQPPHIHITPDAPPEESSSPASPASGSGSQFSERMASPNVKTISAPQNGVRISDAGAWGNKPLASPLPGQQKEHKKRSLFGFHSKDTNPANGPDADVSTLNLSSSQQQYQEQITNVKAAFGAPLQEAVDYCGPRVAGDVCLPAVVYRCLQYLEAKEAANEEGIFRMNGSNTLIRTLKTRFNNEGDLDLLATGQYYDINAVASLLKAYLRDLPMPILPREVHLDFIRALELQGHPQRVAAFNVLVHKLPKANFHLLKALSDYLTTIVKKSNVNKMDIRNLSIVFSPTLNIPGPVIVMFLSEADAIFGDAIENAPIIPSATPPIQALSSNEIRSPRQQMFGEALATPAANQTSFTENQQIGNQASATNSMDNFQDLGFTPMQPSYDSARATPPADNPQISSLRPGGGPDYTIARPRNLGSGDSSLKQSRRESSLMFLGVDQRKGSLPSLRGD